MKKFNYIVATVTGLFAVIMILSGILIQNQSAEPNRSYLVEVNRIMNGMQEQKGFGMPDLHSMKYIRNVEFLSWEELNKTEEKILDSGTTEESSMTSVHRSDGDYSETQWNQLQTFLHKVNGLESRVELLIVDGECLGLVRFDYHVTIDNERYFWFIESILGITAITTLCILLYIRKKLINPFISLSNMPYELAKGHFATEIEENKGRFFGKFVWGVAMLRDNLKSAKQKELELEKEKKMLLLTISHDIKTPLNNIKLYAKALEENVYETNEARQEAAKQIERLSGEIESFVKDIIKTSSEEVVPISVYNSEFYIKELMDKVRNIYQAKCKLILMDLVIGEYPNRLIRGDEDKTFEVIENIMENAFKYGDGRRIEFSFYEEEFCQIIKIRNTGNPAKDEELPHLFDSFYRGSNVGEKDGNGLGLYICREIMRKMDGDIFAEPDPDGMSFHLVFHLL